MNQGLLTSYVMLGTCALYSGMGRIFTLIPTYFQYNHVSFCTYIQFD